MQKNELLVAEDFEKTNISLAKSIEIATLIPWKKEPYLTQSWGNWIHKMSSYCGRIKPAFAHWLITLFSNENDVILDPFCGIGTIPLEANLLNRKSIGVDLNPYAYYVALAKMDRRPLEEYVNYLDNLNLDFSERKNDEVAEWVHQYYNPDTLNEILHLVPKLIKDKEWFILGCLLGISQGHRKGHLSKPSGNIVPYKPKPDENNEYRPAIPILIKKVERICKNGFNYTPTADIKLADTRKMPLKDNSVNVIISSPPYFNTLDYVGVNRLRMEILGIREEVRANLKGDLIQDFKNYLIEMEKCANEMKRVLKSGSTCILILGDLHKGKTVVNTAEEVKKIMEPLGFKTHAMIDDELPQGISVQRRKAGTRLDRILIMTLKK
jgi:hypothetical protein